MFNKFVYLILNIMNIEIKKNSEYFLSEFMEIIGTIPNRIFLIKEYTFNNSQKGMDSSFSYFDDLESFKIYLFCDLKKNSRDVIFEETKNAHLNSHIIKTSGKKYSCCYNICEISDKQFREIRNDYENSRNNIVLEY